MPVLFPNLDLARALEGAEAASSSAFCQAAAEVYPEKDIAALPCAGGFALYYGPNDPLNAVKGVGLNGPVDLHSWNAIEKFFRDRSSPIVIDLCPLADPDFIAALSDRGYKISSFETVNCRDLNDPPATEPSIRSDADVQINQVNPADVEAVSAWSRAIGLGFADGGEPMKFTVDFGKVRTHMFTRPPQTTNLTHESARAFTEPPTSHMLLATVKGVPAGGASMSISPSLRVAHFSGAAVLPQFRRRGIQTALTAARLELARIRGSRYAKLDVHAGSTSHHNAIRAGFQVAYTRPQMIRSWPNSGG
jgi:ribosomal protein S18 acetylase RimI-like enzyme